MKQYWKQVTALAVGGLLVLALAFGAAPALLAQTPGGGQRPDQGAGHPAGLGGIGQLPFGHGLPGQSLTTLAAALGISEDALQSAFDAGQSVAEVAAEQDVALQTVIEALVAEQTTRLAQAVTDGRLTQAQADALAANLRENLPELLNLKPLPASVGLAMGPGLKQPGGAQGRPERGTGQPPSPLTPATPESSS
jgi:hypothetical protein